LAAVTVDGIASHAQLKQRPSEVMFRKFKCRNILATGKTYLTDFKE